MKPQEFKKLYINAKVGKDFGDLIAKLEENEANELYKALVRINEYLGLNLRRDYFKTLLKYSKTIK